MNTKSIHITYMLLAWLLFGHNVLAQTLIEPELGFSAPCASAGFNTFNVNFRWEGALVNSNNVFILELSDASGNFDNAEELASVGDQNLSFGFTFNFAFPDTIRGENYRIRVRSTSPALFSPESNAFPAYFQTVTQNLIINGFDDLETICPGGSVTLSVDNFPGEPVYRWFRNRNLTPIPGETGPALEVTEEGFYFVEVDYGDFCSLGTASNEVEVAVFDQVNIAVIGPSETEICPGTDVQLSANVSDTSFTYRWFRDGSLFAGPGFVPSIDLDPNDLTGSYILEIERNGAGCVETSAAIDITSPSVDVSVLNGIDQLLLPGEDLTLEINTTAIDPTYTWFRNGSIISGEISNTLDIINPGVYQVRVVQGGICNIEAFSSEINVALPNSIEISISPIAGYEDCSNTETTLEITAITAITSDNNTINVRPQLLDEFDYQWFREGVALDDEDETTLEVSDAAKNGVYELRATLNSFDVVSNNIDLRLLVDQTVNITSDGSVSCDGSSFINLTSNVNDPALSYAWFRNNNLISGETEPVLTTNLTGVYRLEVSAFGCPNTSNEITINPFDDSIVTVDASEVIVIPEGSFTIVTASGADSYSWTNEENIEISNVASVTLSEEGSYVLRAFVGPCEVLRMFTLQFQDNLFIPNAISPNADGINDQWVLPNRYAFNQDVEVLIFNSNGETVLQTFGYQNNWPESNIASPESAPVFYFRIIGSNREIVRQGSITLIR